MLKRGVSCGECFQEFTFSPRVTFPSWVLEFRSLRELSPGSNTPEFLWWEDVAPGPVPKRGAEVCGQLPGPDSGATGQSLIFCAEHAIATWLGKTLRIVPIFFPPPRCAPPGGWNHRHLGFMAGKWARLLGVVFNPLFYTWTFKELP